MGIGRDRESSVVILPLARRKAASGKRDSPGHWELAVLGRSLGQLVSPSGELGTLTLGTAAYVHSVSAGLVQRRLVGGWQGAGGVDARCAHGGSPGCGIGVTMCLATLAVHARSRIGTSLDLMPDISSGREVPAAHPGRSPNRNRLAEQKGSAVVLGSDPVRTSAPHAGRYAAKSRSLPPAKVRKSTGPTY